MNRELSLANALAHGEKCGYRIRFLCENCQADLFEIQNFEEKKGNRHEDVIIERNYYLRCVECGSEEVYKVIVDCSVMECPGYRSGHVAGMG